MKNIVFIFIYALVGLICGMLCSLINTAFIPKCGEPCNIHRAGELFSWGIICLIVFSIAGYISIRKLKDNKKRIIHVLFIVFFTTIAITSSIYFYELNKKYWTLEAKQVYVDFDFPAMYISIKNIDAQNSKGGESYEIKQWQKCAGAEVLCESRPRKIKLQCRENGNNVYPLVNEKDWENLKIVESENLSGFSMEKDIGNSFCKK